MSHINIGDFLDIEPGFDAGEWNNPPKTPRKVRSDLTSEELERLKKYGSIEFKSAGATRKR